MLEQRNRKCSHYLFGFQDIPNPQRRPWKADPVSDEYNNVWTQGEGQLLNGFHLQKQSRVLQRRRTTVGSM